MKNHYFTLGLKLFSKAELVKSQYRKLAKLYHPDKNPNNALAEERFKQIANAYDTLSSTEKKAAYDLQLKGGQPISFKIDPEIVRARREKEREALKIHELETRYFKYQKSFFNINIRLGISIFFLGFLSASFISNYFMNYEDLSAAILQAFKGLVYAVFIFVFIDALYLKLAFSQLKKPKRYTALKISSIAFLCLFLGVPFASSIFAHLRKELLLQYHHLDTKILMHSFNEIEGEYTLQFYANYEKYTVKVSHEGIDPQQMNVARIIYYPSDPRLCKLVKQSP